MAEWPCDPDNYQRKFSQDLQYQNMPRAEDCRLSLTKLERERVKRCDIEG